MKNPTPDFPPFTKRQLDLLDEINAEIEKLRTLPPWDPQTGTWVPEFYKIQQRIDDLSVKALRSGLLRGLPADSRRPGFRLVFDSQGESAKVLPGFGDFHPDLPPWAVKHFFDWIQMLRIRRHDARDILRETGIISIETGIKSPIGLEDIKRDLEDIERWKLIKYRVLELRGIKEEENELSNAHSEKKGKRTRKNSATWDMVIDKLVEEKLLPNKISHQAVRKSLEMHLPDTPWKKI